jgi:hypothetical protein
VSECPSGAIAFCHGETWWLPSPLVLVSAKEEFADRPGAAFAALEGN